ncbi:hypothetical protein DFJ77DRAFT_438985 [Powellomyces hirtus]|nr:hypothetical protein DFJ77DRAFT_438985 [Powellomyces hirtus]
MFSYASFGSDEVPTRDEITIPMFDMSGRGGLFKAGLMLKNCGTGEKTEFPAEATKNGLGNSGVLRGITGQEGTSVLISHTDRCASVKPHGLGRCKSGHNPNDLGVAQINDPLPTCFKDRLTPIQVVPTCEFCQASVIGLLTEKSEIAPRNFTIRMDGPIHTDPSGPPSSEEDAFVAAWQSAQFKQDCKLSRAYLQVRLGDASNWGAAYDIRAREALWCEYYRVTSFRHLPQPNNGLPPSSTVAVQPGAVLSTTTTKEGSQRTSLHPRGEKTEPEKA